MSRNWIVPAIAVLAYLCTMPARLDAQDAQEREVVAVIQELFDAMAAGDAERAAATLLPEGQWVSVRPGDDGAGVATAMAHGDFLVRLGEAGRAGERWLERMWEPRVTVHDPIAVVWAPYDFFRDGVFSHCGMDAFTLVRTGAGWRIAGATYTVETAGCPPSPLGPPTPR